MEVHKSSELKISPANMMQSVLHFHFHSNWIYMHAQRISRHETGMSTIRKIGDEGFNSLSAALDSLDPDFKKLLIEGAYADIIARPKLSLRYRELITVAVLTTMGNAEPALKYHAGGMLNTGWTPEALLETVTLTLAYAGAPVAITGARVVTTLLAQRGLVVHHDLQRYVHDTLPGRPRVQSAFKASDALTKKDRQLATLAIVMAQGNQHALIRQHLKACLLLGWKRNELTEVLIQLTGYIGWPIVLPLTRVALDVFAAAASHATGDDPAVSTGIADMSAEIAHCLDEFELTAARSESPEETKARQLTDIACLTCLARNADAQTLAAHVREALALGISRREIITAITRCHAHAGVPAVQSALRIANTAFEASSHSERNTSEDAELLSR
jgi:4-carboxymuconolactone decarboxylase